MRAAARNRARRDIATTRRSARSARRRHRHDRSRIAELYDPRRVLEWGFVAWVIGSLASAPFWQLSFFTGSVATAHPEWGDLSYFVGFAVGALAFALLNRLPPLWHREGAHDVTV